MSTTISGNLKDLSGTNATGNMFLRFKLRGLNGNIPRVNGTALIPQGNGDGSAQYFYDFTPDVNGAITGTLYSTRDAAGTGNGEIEAGGSLTAVWYGMVLYVGGLAGAEIAVHAKNGVTLDPSNVTPLTTTLVVTAGSGDTTYARLDAGNQPFTGTVEVPNEVVTQLGVLQWGSSAYTTPDTGISRTAAATIAVGNATQGNATGTIKAASHKAGSGSAALTTSGSADVELIDGAGNTAFRGVNANSTWADLATAQYAQFGGSSAKVEVTASGGTTINRLGIQAVVTSLGDSASFPNPTAGNILEVAHSGSLVAAVSNTGGLIGATLAHTGGSSLTIPSTGANVVSDTATQTLTNKTLTSPTITNPSTTGTDSGAETLNNKTLTGASSGNSTNLLNQQNPTGILTGNGAAQTVYTYTLPGNTVATGKSLYLRTMFNHSSGTASVSYVLSLNGTSLLTFASSTAGSHVIDIDILNTGAATGAVMELFGATSVPAGATIGSGLAWASNQVLALTFNVANTDQVFGQGWKLTLDQ